MCLHPVVHGTVKGLLRVRLYAGQSSACQLTEWTRVPISRGTQVPGSAVVAANPGHRVPTEIRSGETPAGPIQHRPMDDLRETCLLADSGPVAWWLLRRMRAGLARGTMTDCHQTLSCATGRVRFNQTADFFKQVEDFWGLVKCGAYDLTTESSRERIAELLPC